jgi:hypothetical protein
LINSILDAKSLLPFSGIFLLFVENKTEAAGEDKERDDAKDGVLLILVLKKIELICYVSFVRP